MGINISLYRSDGSEHPEWDCSRHSGDREFAELVGKLPCCTENRASPPDVEWFYRPADFDAWKAAISQREWPNPGRFEHLLDLMAADADAWIYFD